MTKAQWKRYWASRTFKRGRKYWTYENGAIVPGLSWARFWRVVQLQARLAASDPGGNIVL